MRESWRHSTRRGPERPGDALITAGVAATAAVALGNIAPLEVNWLAPLVLVAAAATWRALTHYPAGRSWWAAAGFLVGLAACAAAPSLAAQGVQSHSPVRFTIIVKDGWSDAQWGWRTRVLVEELSVGAQVPVRHPREMLLYLSGTHAPHELLTPGGRFTGSGEVIFDAGRPLSRPYLRVKTALLLRPTGEVGGIHALRDRLAGRLKTAGQGNSRRERAAGLAMALVLGRRESLDRESVVSMRRAGLAHLLAVSGLHVGLVALIAWGLLTILGVDPVWRRWILIAVLAGFAVLAGGLPPVRRAATAGILYLVGRLAGRPLVPLATMWGVVTALLIVEPGVVRQPGFLLSAGVALALVRWAGVVSARFAPRRPHVAGVPAVAVVAHLASAPLVGHFFGAVPPLGVIANLLAVFVAAPVVGASLAATGAAAVMPSAAIPALEAVAASQTLLSWLAGIGGAVVVPVASPPAWLMLGAVVAGVAALTPWRRAAIPALAVGLGFWVWSLAPGIRDPGRFEVRMLDIGEGMAVLLQGAGESLLADTGRWPDEASRALATLRLRSLDTLLLSHPDADHIGGAMTILERHRVGRLVIPAVSAERGEFAEIVELARRRGVEVVKAVPGDEITAGQWRCRVKWPEPDWRGGDNDQSLVARCRGGDVVVLLTGDLEAVAERVLLARGVDLSAHLLQLGHHGSRTSSSWPFLAAVKPRVALAATGTRPRFNFPHPDVTARVRRLPAVMVSQPDGMDRVWWREDGPLVVDVRHPVMVTRGRSL